MIRIAIVLMVSAVMCSCSADRIVEKEPSWNPPEPMKEAYDFELISVEADPDNSNIRGIFRFRHSRQEPIHLWGFEWMWDQDHTMGKDYKSDTFQVRFEQFKSKEEGKWVDVPVYSCGTSAEHFPIQPNRDYRFLIPLLPLAKRGTPGTHGIVILTGQEVEVESTPFETAEIHKLAGSR